MTPLTAILDRAAQGDQQAAEQLLPLVYHELRTLAAAKLAHEKPGQTLQATALVHEAYLRLVGPGVGSQESGVAEEKLGFPTPATTAPQRCPRSPTPGFSSRGHFFAAAAEAMRRILIDRARARASGKRGGNRQQWELTDVPAADEALRVDDLLDLDEALRRLAAVDPVAAKLVELRVFAGQSVEESAAILNLSSSTAKRTWNYARAWLRRAVADDRNTHPNS